MVAREHRDAGAPDPWVVTHWRQDGVLVLHVYPGAGREHTLDATCWCMPTVDDAVNRLGGRSIEFSHRRAQ